jgi:hypothetical protein
LPGNAISVFERIRCDDGLHWIQDKKTAPPLANEFGGRRGEVNSGLAALAGG